MAAMLRTMTGRPGVSVSFNEATASHRAMNPPVMLAVRVPPSASRTSQSIVMVRGPSAAKSTACRRLRPISRWISEERPSSFSRSRRFRGDVLLREHGILGGQPPGDGGGIGRRFPRWQCRINACRAKDRQCVLLE